MPSLTLPDRLIWFAHCPKAGGTSVEQFMVARWGEAVGHLHWGWDRWWATGGWRLADPPNSPQHLIWADAVVRIARTPDAVFATVRDPVARMVSEYHWQRRERRGTRLGKSLAMLPFSIWLRLMLALVRVNPYAFDNHLRPQSEFIPKGARVFQLEDGLQPVADWLEGQTGGDRSGAKLPHALKAGHRLIPNRRDQGLIADAFAMDYARFGYLRPDSQGHDPALTVMIWLITPLVWLERRGRL